jgi:peptidoglycan/xylan/chitin deacetylase (PgdA/CDA1 family)
VKRAAGAFDAVRKPTPGVVVLLYHRVGAGSGLELDLPAARFETQMAQVAGTTRPLPLGAALDELERCGAPPEDRPAAVVTFDDGTADFVDQALPVLVHHRVPVTLYVSTAFVDEQRPFPGGGRPVSWAALRDAVSTGLVEVGSHTHTHALLDRLPPEDVRAEIERSTGLIAEHLGRAPLDFAYPKAVRGSRAAEALIASAFRSAALAGTRPNIYGRTDPLHLARSPVQASDEMKWFARKLAGGMHLEDALRRGANRLRYAGARS